MYIYTYDTRTYNYIKYLLGICTYVIGGRGGGRKEKAKNTKGKKRKEKKKGKKKLK